MVSLMPSHSFASLHRCNCSTGTDTVKFLRLTTFKTKDVSAGNGSTALCQPCYGQNIVSIDRPQNSQVDAIIVILNTYSERVINSMHKYRRV